MRSIVLALALLAAPGLLHSAANRHNDDRSSGAAEAGRQSYLGVGVTSFVDQSAREAGVDAVSGVLVQVVQQKSPADKAGLTPGDIIVALDGNPLSSAAEFGSRVRSLPPARKIHLKVIRNGKIVHLTAVLAERTSAPPPDFSQRVELPDFESFLPDMPSPALRWRSNLIGVEYEGVDSQLAEFFGVKQGVLIRYVRRGSAADQAGLKAGDVLIGIDKKAISGPREVAFALENNQPGERTLPFQIVRDRKEQTIKVIVGADRRSRPWVRPAP